MVNYYSLSKTITFMLGIISIHHFAFPYSREGLFTLKSGVVIHGVRQKKYYTAVSHLKNRSHTGNDARKKYIYCKNWSLKLLIDHHIVFKLFFVWGYWQVKYPNLLVEYLMNILKNTFYRYNVRECWSINT